MDQRRFEEVSRRFAAEASRRGTLRAALAAAAGMLPALRVAAVGADGRPAVGPKGIPIVNCKIVGQHCDKNTKCCSERCRNGFCTCRGKGRACWQPLEGADCCSRRCKKGRCS